MLYTSPDPPLVSAPPVVCPAPSDTGYFELAASQIAAFPFSLAPGGSIAVNAVQRAGISSQDFSIRVWISDAPNGEMVTDPGDWHPNRLPNRIMTVYDRRLLPPGASALALQPGDYYVNVQNLENRPNVFYLLLTNQ